ncbi:hypothetical protein AMATHDRAFT_50732 [Amanita thiersii Skay4041]|uniref:Cyanovirin-N domain-containing protein n=1 Tax=Amanita thiersii Skay4041 TaxID=703135 RepID=A0A2A9N8S2_9AGAR|nr:hypothetical protein AMATHDRAFT_50732 [Amanita thiersii Skay4041]
MHFTTIIAAAAISLLAPAVSAADCVQQSGYAFSRDFCKNYQGAQNVRNGWSSASSTGKWSSSGQCEDAFQNIISQCYGQKDGGKYDYNDSHMTVYFCNCESA